MSATNERSTDTPSFAVQVEARGTVSAVEVHGELDIATADPLREALDAAVEAASEILVIDLTATSFIDSMGLHAVLACERRARAAGIGIVVVGAIPAVRRVFDLAGLDGRLAFA